MLMPVIDWKAFLAARGAKIALISLASVLGVSGIGVAGYYLWPEPAPKPPPPLETSTHEENVDYMASDDFNRLPIDRRLAYVESRMERAARMGDDEFFDLWKNRTEAQRRRIRNNMEAVMRERASRHARTFAKLPSGQRDAYLDERIDEMEVWRPKMRKLAGVSRDRSGRIVRVLPRDRAFIERQRQVRKAQMVKGTHHFLVEESGDARAKNVAYFTAIGKRRTERGLGRLGRLFGGKKKRK